jgi:hypothetical protein
MNNLLFDLAINLAILTTLLIACHLCNLVRPDLELNGGYVFAILAATAMLFDAALTFLVFADAQNHYGKFSSPSDFVQRASACALVCAIAIYVARRARMHRTKSPAGETIVIHTSAYTESHLPM